MKQPFVIGVDMGGTNSSFAVVDARGTIVYKDSIQTISYTSADEYADALCYAINKLIKDNSLDDKIKGIGMGVPKGNYYKGTIEYAANIPWANQAIVPLARMITERIGLPCTLTNDANAAAIGEMTYGVARGMKDFILITLGTGVGSGIVANGQLIVGHDGFAGELGHVCVQPHDRRPCGCGRSGCLETYASATGVARTAKEFLDSDDRPSLLREIIGRPITSKDIYNAAEKGDKLSIEIFNYTGKILGEAFANFIAFSSPEAIVLFGGLTKAGDLLVNPIRKALDDHALNIYKGKTKLLLSELNDAEAAILGASALGWENRQ